MTRLAALALLLCSCGPSIIEKAPLQAGRRGRFHRFRVQATSVPTEIRHDLTQREISRLPGASSALKTQGLTLIKHSLATHTRFSTATDSSAVYAWFDDVILEVAISSVVIHIPKEYPSGSCEYDAILDHERDHGRAARDMAVDVADKLERALTVAEGLPTRFDPVIASDYASAAEQLKASVAKVVDPVYERYEKEEKAAQEKLDRPDPYDAVYKKCDGWK